MRKYRSRPRSIPAVARFVFGERGTEVVEWAFALPLYFLILVGIVEFARAAIIFTMLQDAARAGARYAVVYPNDTAGIVQAAQAAARNAAPDQATVTVACPAGACASGQPIEVTVQYQFHSLSSILPGVGPSGVSLTTHARMIVE